MTRAGIRLLISSMAVLPAAAGRGQPAADSPGRPATNPAAARVVYRNGFDDGAGREWSAAGIEETPKGGRKFLGRFCGEHVGLSVSDLPPHKMLRISFDLLLTGPWKGGSPEWGPDVWELSVAGGPTLLRATFSNVDFYAGCKQSFPDAVAAAQYPPATGAAEEGSLGYAYEVPGEISERAVDSVYRFSFAFPHSRGEITLSFSALGLEENNGEAWGLDNVKLEALADFAHPSQEAMAELWAHLAGENGQLAFEAAWGLVAAGDAAVGFIADQLDAVVTHPDRVAALVRRLDDDDWRKREDAAAALIKMGPAAEKQLKDALDELGADGSLEVRLRIEDILNKIVEKPVSAEGARLLARARHVLDVINSPKALELRGRLPPVRQTSANAAGSGEESPGPDGQQKHRGGR